MPQTMRDVIRLLQQAFDAFVKRQEIIVEHLTAEIRRSHELIRDMRAYINHDPSIDREQLLARAEKIVGKE